MIELLVTSNLNLTTGACTRELTVKQDGMVQSQTPLSPVEYAQLVQQAQTSTSLLSRPARELIVEREPAPAPRHPAPSLGGGPEDFGGEDFPSGFQPEDDGAEPVEAVEPPPATPRRPPPPPSVVRTPTQVPPPGRRMPAAVPAPPAPGVGVAMSGVKAPKPSGKPAGRAPRTIGQMIKSGSQEGMDDDEGPNASPVEASQL